MRTAVRTLVAVGSAALVLSSCGSDGPDDIAGGPWSAWRADGHNSAASDVEPSSDAAVRWSRPTGGAIGQGATTTPNGAVTLTSRTDSGCNVFAFDLGNGRKEWCAQLDPSVTAVAPSTDFASNVYLGEAGSASSYTERGQRRWRTPVAGTPRSAQFLGDGNVLVVTHLGQVNVLNPQTGKPVAPLFDIVPVPGVADGSDIARPAPDAGLDACFGGSPDCPVATTPAVDPATGLIALTFRRVDRDGADLLTLRYRSGDGAGIERGWNVDDLPGGVSTAPVLSADASRIYVHDGDGALWALDASDGRRLWSHDLGYRPSTAPSVTADGLIVPAPSADGRLIGLHDDGDSVSTVFDRSDVPATGPVAIATGSATGYTVVRGDDGLVLLAFDTGCGDDRARVDLPDAVGAAAGIAFGPDDRIVVTTVFGEVYTLD